MVAATWTDAARATVLGSRHAIAGPRGPVCSTWHLATRPRLSHVSGALSAFRPRLVICSWMPMGVDWSRAFRNCDDVDEYVLLGEADDGSCGHLW